MRGFSTYLANCFWLLIPIFVWNLVFYRSLPAIYTSESAWGGISPWIVYGEHVLRALVFLIPLLMVFELGTGIQKAGLAVYVVGLLVYFASWVMQMWFPDSGWDRSAVWFSATAWTPLIWLTGIAMIGQRSFLPISQISWIYMGLAVAFVSVHTAHSVLAFRSYS